MFYQAIQKVRRLFGLTHDVVERATYGSGSTQVIPKAEAPTLQYVDQRDRYKAYDPIAYRRSDLARNTEYVTNTFNKLCSQVGVQCTVGKDATDWKTVFRFENFNHDKLVRIRWQENKMQCEVLLEPRESTQIKIGGSLTDFQQYPEVKAFQYGED